MANFEKLKLRTPAMLKYGYIVRYICILAALIKQQIEIKKAIVHMQLMTTTGHVESRKI